MSAAFLPPTLGLNLAVNKASVARFRAPLMELAKGFRTLAPTLAKLWSLPLHGPPKSKCQETRLPLNELDTKQQIKAVARPRNRRDHREQQSRSSRVEVVCHQPAVG